MVKIIFAISRIFFILFIWTIGYFFWLQRLMMSMWGFNPTARQHWLYIWNEWQNGWIIQSVREWSFVIVLFAMLPVWLTGSAILCTIPWLKWFKIILLFPLRFIRNKIKEKNKEKKTARPKVTKKKSYKQTRPPAIRAGSGKIKHPDKAPEKEESPQNISPAAAPAVERSQATSAPVVQKATNTASSAAGGSVMDILRSAGYRLITYAKIAGKKIDFAAVAANHILLCLIDSESGDWLADEERFNDEEPLWFSESNHRISPVRVVLNARDALASMLTGTAKGLEIKAMVVIRQGTIINAEDMFEVWNGLNVTVCRFDEGGPDEITNLQNAVSSVGAPDDGLYHSISNQIG